MKEGLPFRILIVDDDEDDRILINEAFMEIGFGAEVKKFPDGKMLLRYLDQLEPSLYPSLIVLDNTLPELQAADLISILKANTAYEGIPVVVYTTMLSPAKERQLLSSGAYACFEKGSTFDQLILTAKKLRSLAESNLQEP